MKLKLFFEWFKDFFLPYCKNRFIERNGTLTEKGAEFIIYLKRVICDKYEPKTLQEQMFESYLKEFMEETGKSREEAAFAFASVLAPTYWVPFNAYVRVKENEEKCIKAVSE